MRSLDSPSMRRTYLRGLVAAGGLSATGVAGCIELDDIVDESDGLEHRQLSATGFTVEDIGLQSFDHSRELHTELQNELPIEAGDMIVQYLTDSVMIVTDTVSEDDVISALEDTDVDASTAEIIPHDDEGRLEAWQQTMEDRFATLAMDNATTNVRSGDDDADAEVAYPPEQEALVDELLTVGYTETWIMFPDGESYGIETVLTHHDISDTTEVSEATSGYQFGFTIKDESVDLFIDSMQAAGFDEHESWGGQACDAPSHDVQTLPDIPDEGWGHCLGFSRDNINWIAYPINPNLGQNFAGDDPYFANAPAINIQFNHIHVSKLFRVALEHGPLPTVLN